MMGEATLDDCALKAAGTGAASTVATCLALAIPEVLGKVTEGGHAPRVEPTHEFHGCSGEGSRSGSVQRVC